MRLHSLTTRFVLTLLLSTVVPFLVFAWLVRGAMRGRQEVFVDGLLALEAESVGTRLANRLEQLHRECSLFRGVAERALAGEISLGAFRDEVEFSPAFHGEYQLVVLADDTGRVRAVVDSVGQDSPTSAARAALRPTRVAEAPWFAALVQPGSAASGQYWLDRHLSTFLHAETEKLSRNPADYSFGLAFPVVGAGRLLGVVLALKRWERIQTELDGRVERLERRYPSAEAALFDSEGRILAHTERSAYANGSVPAAIAGAVPDVPEVVSFRDAEGEPQRAGLVRVSRVADRIDWRCGIWSSERDLFRESRQFGDLLLAVTVAVGAILVVWASIASRAILRPVRRLALATERVAAGDLEARVPVLGHDELADLGSAFNDMAAEVAVSREKLRDAARQAAWAEMARQVAHEIKNPLTPMRMSAQLLLRANRAGDPRLPELVERLARTVQEQTDQLARIATDFRQFAGEPARRVAPVRVGELLADVERDFAAASEHGASLRCESTVDELVVDADRQELRRVYLNLVQNAFDAGGGAADVLIRAAREGDEVVFRVVDRGPGIDEAVRARLFEPYFTTRSSGTGLGLAISRRIVEAHGGSIELAASEPGRTEFRFSIPVADGA